MKKNNIIFTSVVVALALVFSCVYTVYEKANAIETSGNLINETTIIIDAGHGGFDGGTSGVDGAVEKDINLSVAKKVKSQLELMGINCIMTRTEDVTTADDNLKTTKEKKTSDIKNRLKLVNDTPNSVLLSIHQNFYTTEKYSGLQVFYSGNNEQSEQLASLLQTNTHDFLQPDNTRQIKKAESNLYLLYKATAPSVLVECGFMSNTEENKKLQDDAYQTKLAYIIALSVNQYINQTNHIMSGIDTTEAPDNGGEE